MEQIIVEDYSLKAFKIHGPGANDYSGQIRAMGGKWNRYLRGGPGYIISKRHEGEINALLDRIKRGEETPQPYVPGARTMPTLVPTAGTVSSSHLISGVPRQQPLAGLASPELLQPRTVPTITDKMQTVTWRVIKPQKDQMINIQIGDSKYPYQIRSVHEHGGIIDEAYISPTGKPDADMSKLVITNGKWQVFGFAQEHEVAFQDL